MSNNNLNIAKVVKNDDFFTQLCDIEAELQYYWDKFKGKTILCNCDNPEHSNFWVYFHKNFSKMGLKKLISTHFSVSDKVYSKIYSGGNDNDITVGDITYLRGNGDFRSAECIQILKEADVVVTNPPFSLMREYITQLMDYNKTFVIIANINTIVCKNIFPYFKNNKMWLGITSGSKSYVIPDEFADMGKSSVYQKDGIWYQKFGNTCWFTNIDIPRCHNWVELKNEYSSELYPKYDNYDAISVNRVSEIPFDYFESFIIPQMYKDKLKDFYIYESMADFDSAVRNKELTTVDIAIEHRGSLIIPVIDKQYMQDNLIHKGIPVDTMEYRNGHMGVPLTFMDKFCDEQFDLIDIDFNLAVPVRLSNGKRGKDRFYLSEKRLYTRIVIKRKFRIGG